MRIIPLRIQAYLADFLCFYRIIISIAITIIGIHSFVPWLFGIALLTDVLDGWCYRRLSLRNPYWIPWNPFMVSTNQLANLTFIICGVFYVGYYSLGRIPLEPFLVDAGIIAGAWLLSALPNFFTRRYRTAYTFCITLLTHLACLLMLLVTVGVWYANRDFMPGNTWIFYAACNIIMFYLLFFIVGDFSHLIRRPD